MTTTMRQPTEIAFVGDTLSWTLDNEVVEVTLHRHPANEIGTHTLAELERLARFIQEGAGGARALILHSAVAHGFSAGADLRELYQGIQARKDAGMDRTMMARELRAFVDRIHAVLDCIDNAPFLTIAAVHGVVFGGGFELALTCDLIVADRSTRFAFPELRLGLIPGWGGIPRLKRDVGNAVVRDLLLTGRSLSATRAHAVGITSQLVGRGEALKVAHAVAKQATRFSPRTTKVAKRFIKPYPRHELTHEKELFCELFISPEVEEALHRFVNTDNPMPYLP